MSDYDYTTIPGKPNTADELWEWKRRKETWDESIRRLLED